MSLVNYSSSEEDEPISTKRDEQSIFSSSSKGKRKLESPIEGKVASKMKTTEQVTLPQLPDLFEIDVVTLDSKTTSKDQGKVRNFPHIEGNYPTFVFIPVTFPTELMDYIHKLSPHIQQQNPHIFAKTKPSSDNTETEAETMKIEPYPDEELHISLSRPIALRQHQIETFVSLLKDYLKNKEHCFPVAFTGYKWFTNDEHNRSFLTLDIDLGRTQICSLIAGVNEVLSSFGLPTFHKDPKPHVTIGWVLNDILPDLVKVEDTFPDLVGSIEHTSKTENDLDLFGVNSGVTEGELSWMVPVDSVVCKSGKWSFAIK